MKMSNNFGALSDMFKGMFGNDDSKKFVEFKTGADRQKHTTLEKRVGYQQSFYRKSMPAPVSGSAPGIDEQTNKIASVNGTDSVPDTGKGVNFFGYGGQTNVNRLNEEASKKVDTNKNATGQVKIGGFTTFKKPMSESDYGQGDVSGVADSSFYRNKLETDRYGAMYATNIIGPKGGGTNVVSYTTIGAEIAFGRESKKVQDKIAQINAGDPKSSRSDPSVSSGNDNTTTTSGYTASNPDPLAQVPRKLPSTDTEKDLFLKKYLTDKHEIIYKPRGELPEGGTLPNSPLPTTGIFSTYNQSLDALRNKVGNNESGESSQSQRNSLFKSIYQADGSGKQLNDISEDYSPLIVSDQPYKKTLFNRRSIVYNPPKVEFDFDSVTIDRKNRADTTDIDTFSSSAQSGQTFEVNGINANLDKRIDSRYLESTEILPERDDSVKKNAQKFPANTIIQELNSKNTNEDAKKESGGNSGRFVDQNRKFQENYEVSLKNMGADSDNKAIHNLKNYNLLAKLAEDGLVSPGKRSVKGETKSGELTYEQLFKNNPFRLESKKVPNYYLPGSTDASNDNPRSDAFNKQSVLDALDESKKGEWTKLDFIPLYFHDLVNKKYVPFRSFINSMSDQSDAEWINTRYLGRADEVSVYTGFSRTMSIDFNVVAFSVEELLPMWQRINYMVGLTKPAKYTNGGFIVPPLVKFNLGDIYRNQPVTITSVSTSIPTEATWELLNSDKSNGDVSKNTYEFANGAIKKDNVKVARYPTMCTLSVSMKLLEKQTPETIQNHFGTSRRNSNTETNSGVFNKNLSVF